MVLKRGLFFCLIDTSFEEKQVRSNKETDAEICRERLAIFAFFYKVITGQFPIHTLEFSAIFYRRTDGLVDGLVDGQLDGQLDGRKVIDGFWNIECG